MPNNPNIVSITVEWVYEGQNPETELVIVTDLETRPDAPNFDAIKFNAMVEAAVQMNATGTHRKVRVQPKEAK